MSARDSTLVIETPEGVVFSYELATVAVRALAWAVDAAAIATAGSSLGKLAEMAKGFLPDLSTGFSVALYFLLSIAYAMVLEWRWRGQTVGKRLFGLRVIDAQGLKLHFSQIALRNLMRFVDILPVAYLVGGTASVITRKCQRLGDLAANTVVAHERRREIPNLEQIAPARYNSLLAYPHLAARLRSAASPEAVGMAVRALGQRNRYEPSARVELFSELAQYFRTLAAFPEAALEGLTDEQYLASVLRVVYAGTSGRPAQDSAGARPTLKA
jgi:uncharacterized RDD family membrane protein YckC